MRLRDMRIYDPYIIGKRGDRWIVAHERDADADPGCVPISTHGSRLAALRMADRLNAAHRMGWNACQEEADQ